MNIPPNVLHQNPGQKDRYLHQHTRATSPQVIVTAAAVLRVRAVNSQEEKLRGPRLHTNDNSKSLSCCCTTSNSTIVHRLQPATQPYPKANHRIFPLVIPCSPSGEVVGMRALDATSRAYISQLGLSHETCEGHVHEVRAITQMRHHASEPWASRISSGR